MYKLKKRGDSEPEFTVKLILILIVIVAFIPFYYYFKVKITEGSIREIRYQNVKNIASTNALKFNTYNEINFPIIRKKVKNGEEIKESSKALVEDWSDLLKGEKQLFPSKKEEIVYCVPGHYLEFRAKNKKIPANEYIEFQSTKTLNDIGAEQIIGDGNTIISDYLRGYTTNEAVFQEEMEEVKTSLASKGVTIVSDEEFLKSQIKLKDEYSINTDYEYTTVFVYMKKGHWPKWLTAIIGTNIGIIGGSVVGATIVYFTGGGILVISAVAVGAAGTGIGGGVLGYIKGSDLSADWNTGIFLVPNNEEILKDLNCDILPTKGE